MYKHTVIAQGIALLLSLFPLTGQSFEIHQGLPLDGLKAMIEAESDVQQHTIHTEPLPRTYHEKTIESGGWTMTERQWITPAFETSDYYNLVGKKAINDPNRQSLLSALSPAVQHGTPVDFSPSTITRKVADDQNHYLCSITQESFYHREKIVQDELVKKVVCDDHPESRIKQAEQMATLMVEGIRGYAEAYCETQFELTPTEKTTSKPAILQSGSERVCAYLEEAKRHGQSLSAELVHMGKNNYYITRIRMKKYGEL
ncbi:hypothetical protein [Sansalvadorimonas verongulae]|uniref:hypothetical protein n=1 Tax=Sansalvadorimonas verongulae TaxID=2172824 RepID=UPI0012BB52F7|nr:hypothetical protein [Sansalvadorimonas verongulae]MTI13319.1 hypothetical protein [Sansalvadorimonas verongulae]